VSVSMPQARRFPEIRCSNLSLRAALSVKLKVPSPKSLSIMSIFWGVDFSCPVTFMEALVGAQAANPTAIVSATARRHRDIKISNAISFSRFLSDDN
jgi:hypothetical protein